MAHLEKLTADHAAALLRFETDNRAYFAASIPDRGDDYFTQFAQRHQALLDEQATGAIHMHVLVDDGVIVGRVNLVDVADGAAELGYRVARAATGRGLATAGVIEVCRLARDEYGLDRLRAGTSRDNVASQKVLTNAGFTALAEPTVRGGIGYALDLSASST